MDIQLPGSATTSFQLHFGESLGLILLLPVFRIGKTITLGDNLRASLTRVIRTSLMDRADTTVT